VSETTIPESFAALTPGELEAFNAAARAEAATLIENTDGVVSDENIARATQLMDAIDEANEELARKATVAAETAAKLEALRERAKPAVAEPVEEAPDADEAKTEETPAVEENAPEGETVTVPDSPAELSELVAAATTAAVAAALTHYSPATTRPAIEANTRKLNPTMSEIRARAPQVEGPRSESVLVASSDIPGFTAGSSITDGASLTRAVIARSKHLRPVHGGGERVPIASFQREHNIVMSPSYDRDKFEALLNRSNDMEALVAAGGWCAPSQIDYDLFNIVCTNAEGLLDLPTTGIERGGLRWPISPTFAEVAASDGLWHWTETQDVAAVTGTAQSGVKTCDRAPCPDFLEARLACDGICLTAGNLTQDAYPETIDNFLTLLQAANAHKINGLRIAQLIASSIAVSGFTGLGAPASGVVANVLGAIELQAIDYRELYRMCETAVLEVVLPRWLRGTMRSDLRRRTGVQIEAYNDAMLMSLFDALNVRVQWVTDWQSGTAGFPGGPTPALLWPSTVQFMIYAPGTFILGQGMTLDLGVIRDSTLNATNDFTAAWMEECWLIAQRGHQSRLVTVNICPNGTTGAANYTACNV
jgi:hypothetical protein